MTSLSLEKLLSWYGDSGSARNSSMPRDTCSAPATLPVFSTSGASRTSTTSAPCAISARVSSGVTFGTAAFAAAIMSFSVVAIVGSTLISQSALAERGPDQLERVVARPFGRARDGADLAAVRIDQHRRRHSEGFADGLEVLEGLGARVRIVGQIVHADLLQELLRLVGVAGVDVDGDDLEVRAAELLFERIERRHLRAAGHAPGGPEIEEHRLALEVGQREFLAAGVLEGEVRHLQRALGDVHRRDLTAGERGDLLRQRHRRPAGLVAPIVARKGRNPVYPGQPDHDSGEDAGQDQGQPFDGKR